MYHCYDCGRDCDIMIDGYHEMKVGGAICDKCMYGEWTQSELDTLKDQSSVDECGCRNGCAYCLMIEARSFR